jgi:HD-GYP domain-containing protein (c-di-GMP phosphodiesterase class II)
MLDEDHKLQNFVDVSLKIAEINDLDVLLEMILTYARECVNADSGTIYIKKGNDLHFTYAQNETLRKRLKPGNKLIYTSFSMPINRSSISGYVAFTGEILNIDDVYQLTNDVPYSFNSSYDQKVGYRSTSMLSVPMLTSRGEIIGVLQIINALDSENSPIPFTDEDVKIIRLYANNAAIALERAQMTRTLLLRMIGMAELRDPKETGPHVNRVAAYSIEIYERWAENKGIPADVVNRNRDILRMAAMLHDVGKVAISDAILKKPGRFTPEEYDIMKTHTFQGAKLFANPSSAFDEAAIDVVMNHHENWDGSGYPGYVEITTGEADINNPGEDGNIKKKYNDNIPVFGRVVALADVFDAMISRRCYKDPIAESEVIEIMRSDSGKKFDPEMFDAFLEVIDNIRAISDKYKDEEGH